jgi:hypothetical protein
MTHGSIANVVPGIAWALGFESGKSWSEDFTQAARRVDQGLRGWGSAPGARQLLQIVTKCHPDVIQIHPFRPLLWASSR